MTLDAQARGLLDALAAQGLKGFEEMTVPEARETAYAFIDLEGEAEHVEHVSNETVPVAGGEIPVRIYKPAGAGPHPVVVYFHGGGFVFGDLEVVDKVCRSWSNAAKAAVVSVGYRKAPEHAFPVAPEDCYAATCWTIDNAARLGLDATRVAVCGDSAGGNLAAVVSMMARDRNGPKLAHQVLVYPVTDARGDYLSSNEAGAAYPSRAENATGYLLTGAAMDWFFNHYFSKASDRESPYASPITASLAGLPPATVITAGFDPLRDEGDAYAAALSAAGVPVDHIRNPTMIHGFCWLMGAIGHTRSVYDRAGQNLQAAFAVPVTMAA